MNKIKIDLTSYKRFLGAANNLIDVIKIFPSLHSSTTIRLHLIAILDEMEHFILEQEDYIKQWKSHYPLDVDRNLLVQLMDMFETDSDNGLYNTYILVEDRESLMNFQNYHREEWRNHRVKKGEVEQQEILTEARFGATDYLISQFAYYDNSEKARMLTYAAHQLKTDDMMFNRIFEKQLTLFNMEESFCSGFTEAGIAKLQGIREAILDFRYWDVLYYVKYKLNVVYTNFQTLLDALDNPDDEICEHLYLDAESMYESVKREHEVENERWRRFNSRKKDYHKRLAEQKNAIRDIITSQLWDQEWEDLFEYEDERDVQPDYFAIGSFIHYRFQEMQADDNRKLIMLVQYINDWLFYTWEEMNLLSHETPEGDVVIPLPDDVLDAIRNDLHFKIVKEVKNTVPQPSVVMNIQEYVANKGDNYGSQIVNKDNAKVIQALPEEAKKLLEQNKK